MKNPRSVQFQINLHTRLPKGIKITSAVATEAVKRWLEGDILPNGWRIRIVIWEADKKHEITEIDSSPRGDTLRATLLRAIKSRKLQIQQMGSD